MKKKKPTQPNINLLNGALKTLFVTGVIALAAPTAGYANATVKFEWSNPEKYTDLDNRGYRQSSLKDFSREMEGYISRLANRFLPDGSQLQLVVTDVDLAGDFEPWHMSPWDDVRVVRSIYPPRMTFDYTLTGKDGKVIEKGNEHLVDLTFDMNVKRRVFEDDQYFYEKEMLGDWIRTRFKTDTIL